MVERSRVSQHLLAFAKLYEDMAEQCWSEESALRLREEAQRCRTDAAECDRDMRRQIHEPVERTCNGFCLHQARAALQAADSVNVPSHRATLLVMASHWNTISDECDGLLHPWTEWCHKPLDPKDRPLAQAPFMAHFFSTYFPGAPDEKEVVRAYRHEPQR